MLLWLHSSIFSSSADVAISCPFGGEDQQGLVYIYNGYSEGLREKPSQVIAGQWAANTFPASFGFALRGAKDLDMNGYPGERGRTWTRETFYLLSMFSDRVYC